MTSTSGEVPFQSPSDDEFDTFLQDVTSNTTIRFDKEAYLADLDSRINAALSTVGYSDLSIDMNRRREVAEGALDHFREQGIDTSDPSVNIHAENVVDIVAGKEQLLLQHVRILTAIHEGNQIEGVFDLVRARGEKAELMATAEIVDGFDQSDPLLRAANAIIPGGDIQPDDPLLESKRLEALEKVANEKQASENRIREIDDILKYAGLYTGEATTIEQVEAQTITMHQIVRIMIVGNSYTASQEPNAAATRLEKLHEMAREYGYDSETTRKLIEIIEQKFPIDYTEK